eukprot:Lankesteria_metandrocarpae@DN5470_c1_g1_i4.p1
MLMLMAVVAAGNEALGKKVDTALQAGEKAILVECLSDTMTCFSYCLTPKVHCKYTLLACSAHDYLNFIPCRMQKRAIAELGDTPTPFEVYNWCLDNEVVARPVMAKFMASNDRRTASFDDIAWGEGPSFVAVHIHT